VRCRHLLSGSPGSRVFLKMLDYCQAEGLRSGCSASEPRSLSRRDGRPTCRERVDPRQASFSESRINSARE